MRAALSKGLSREELVKLKARVSRRHHLAKTPSNADILKVATASEKKKLRQLLLKKPTRSISGVSVVAVMARPWDCPHGKCSYCPRGSDAPQSYTGEEPAALRARFNKFSATNQVKNRLQQLRETGHPTDKVELIIMGGTFPAQPVSYQKQFVKDCLDAMSGKKTKTLAEAKKACETSKVRPIGITFETRPDYCKEKEIKRMLQLGATRVELGVQNVYDSIYKKVNRGHTVLDVIESTKLMKDAGLKVLYHMMPGLPGSSLKKDLTGFKTIFSDQRFKPDMIKIYPTLVMPGTELYDDWKAGKYKPLTSIQAAKLVSKIKQIIPPWIRIMRVQRDIPANLIAEGVKKSNLRQLATANCKCIRCREVGHNKLKPENIEIKVQKYNASGGVEYFISAEDFEKGVLVGYLRLRKTQTHDVGRASRYRSSAPTRWLVRELHVYGVEVPIGEDEATAYQHKGWGKKLLQKAEEIADEKLYVLSGIGAKEYYRNRGYKDDGVYVVRYL
ncbi:MAG: tRNA uridine(34) 5-carboxymethylaminomethyl modification radical SAM/GNAT enzyme Elp3 [archaeon]